ncbi:MAG: hypothetical protein NTY14_03060 [Candidatus Omnitrophica bacterium]|nr:hypothetical protein [Candidatus Omnitrophota bacterium]
MLILIIAIVLAACFFCYLFFCSILERRFLSILEISFKLNIRGLSFKPIYRKIVIAVIILLHALIICVLYVFAEETQVFLVVSFLFFTWVLLCYCNIQKPLLMQMKNPGEVPVYYLTNPTFFSKFIYISGFLFALSLYINYGIPGIVLVPLVYYSVDYFCTKHIKIDHDRKMSGFIFKTNILGLYKQYVQYAGYERSLWPLFGSRVMVQVFFNLRNWKTSLEVRGEKTPSFESLYEDLIEGAKIDVEHLDLHDCPEFTISSPEGKFTNLEEMSKYIEEFNSRYLNKQKRSTEKFLSANKVISEVMSLIEMDLIEHIQPDMDIVKQREFVKNKYWPIQLTTAIDYVEKIEKKLNV